MTSVDLTLHYDPLLLRIPAVNLGAGLPSGSYLQSDLSVPGIVTLQVSSHGNAFRRARTGAIGCRSAAHGNIRQDQVLDIGALSINDGTIAATGDDGVQLVAYFGDATGNKAYSSLDGRGSSVSSSDSIPDMPVSSGGPVLMATSQATAS